MASYYWIKLYHEILDDAKMGRLPDRLWRRVIECFLMAGEEHDDGWLPSLDDMAWRLRTNPEQLKKELSELAEVGILERKEGRWFVVNFADRQSAESSAERVRRYRERKRKREYYEDETPEQQESNEPVTNRYTDIDKEVEKEEREYINAPAPEATEREFKPAPHTKDDQDRRELLTAVASVVKETYAPGFNDERFDSVVDALFRDGVEPDKVDGFSDWWQENGYYNGQPALKSFVGEWGNYSAGLQPRASPNGHGNEPEPKGFAAIRAVMNEWEDQ